MMSVKLSPCVRVSQQIADCFHNSVQEELKAELAELEQDVLDERLSGADRAPVASPVSRIAASKSPFFC